MPTTGVIANGGNLGTDVSADGRTIVGAANDARGIQNAAIWLRAAEWRLLGGFADGGSCDAFLSTALGTSRDGKVVVGQANKGCTETMRFGGKNPPAWPISEQPSQVITPGQKPSPETARDCWLSDRRRLLLNGCAMGGRQAGDDSRRKRPCRRCL
jgi:uncharacterized membrane protein